LKDVSGQGGFQASGTTNVTSGIALPYPTITGASSNDMSAHSTWNDTYLECEQGVPPTRVFLWELWLNSVATQNGTPGAPAVAAGKCDTASPNIAIKYYTTNQDTWSDGVNLGATVGISLSSQDGWTTDTELIYDLKTSAPICGVHNYPNANNASAGYLQVR